MEQYTHDLRDSINTALAVSYRRNMYDGKAVFVGHITLVKGVPFYGYHVGYRHFLKVYMLNPLNMTRFSDLLYQGAILGQPLQPFEAHLQYLLQWMCDFNLYGCSYIDTKVVKFRDPVPSYEAIAHTKHKWHSQSIPPELISDTSIFPRQSHCSIEVDIRVQDILNRSEVELRDLHADFVERFKPQNPDEKLVHSLAGLWRDETRRRKRRMGLSDTSSSPFPPEVLVSMSADPRNHAAGGWIHEEEFRQMVKKLVEAESQQREHVALHFDDFVKPDALGADVKTVLESVEDLFAENLQQTLSFETREAASDTVLASGADHFELVDVQGPYVDENDYPYESDEEVAKATAVSQIRVAGAEDGSVNGHAEKGQNDLEDSDEMTRREDWRHQRYAMPSKDASTGTGSLGHLPQPLPEQPRDDWEGLYNEPRTGGDLLDADRPQKRRKLGANGSTHGASPLRKLQDRKVSFLDPQDASKSLFEDDHAADQAETRPPNSSQQLSQTSIKSSATSSQSDMGFTVTKAVHEDSKLETPRPPPKLSSLKTLSTPMTIIRARANEISSRTPDSATSRGDSSIFKSTRSAETTPKSSQVAHLAQQLSVYPRAGLPKATLCFASAPPTFNHVDATMSNDGRPAIIYQDAYYSNEVDVPERARDYAGREFRLQSDTLPFLPNFDPSGESLSSYGQGVPAFNKMKEEQAELRQRQRCRLRHWEILKPAPSFAEVNKWAKSHLDPTRADARLEDEDVGEEPTDEMRQVYSQIEGPTQRNKHGFKFSQKMQSTSVRHETQYMSTMSLEVHVNSRAHFAPNPEEDSVCCIFWCVKSDDEDFEANGNLPGTRVGILALRDEAQVADRIGREAEFEVEHEDTELDLINRLLDIVRTFDPDILTGYEVHNGSWGYLIERARVKFEYNLCDELSRMKSQSHGRFGKDADRWGFNTTSTIRVTGRHMINIWRAMRSELNLLQYSMENVVSHLLHKRIPHYSHAILTEWYRSNRPADLAKVIDYFVSRVQLNLEILDANELVARTSEQARLIGVDFFSVFSRGSQFKVESFMFRIAKPENFILVSPSRKQVGQQNALECLPLVMEPQSDFYSSPLVVLDFQSLYPSLMIAYNYCYSTCLGRVVPWRGRNKLGFSDFQREPGLLELVRDSINIAPNGMMYVKPEMRKSLLAKMLGEILETRVMVKSGMKVDKQDKTLQQLLNNRQLALKLLANVTYGYTSASFSGRLPASEIADSIVQTGRETLERAIALIHSVERWGAEVVYGDTDSLFIYFKGRTRAQAFELGQEIAKEVTAMNPKPVKLKFEKVYHPCVLLAKKRYVGFKYEAPSQEEPEFEAKGIETVRRDGTPAEQKIEEKALKILFRTADLSQVKAYFQRQCNKIMSGRVSVQDFCYAREVKLGTYADKGPPPPGALISTRRMLEDPRLEPQYGERVPYVVISGAPGARLIDRCVAPEQLLRDESMQLDAEYYIAKNLIPPLERIFNLVGANVRMWYDEMPKVLRIRHAPAAALLAGPLGPARRTLEGYMKSSHCAVCRAKLPPPTRFPDAPRVLCAECAGAPAASVWALQGRSTQGQRRAAALEAVCRSCSGLSWGDEVRCDSKDCPVYYTRIKARAEERRMRALVEEVDTTQEGAVGW